MSNGGTFEKNISLLLIEEDQGEQSVFEKFFKAQDYPYNYTVSISVRDACQRLRQHHFDVIVSDISFSDGNAFDLLPHARGIPFIIVTAKGDEEIAVKAIKEGVSEYIVRDIERNYLNILPSKIKQAARRKRNELITNFLMEGLRITNESICAFTQRGRIIFANKSFCTDFRLEKCYYLADINTILRNFEITGFPDIKTFLHEERKEEIRYVIRDPRRNRDGSIRLIPILSKSDMILGYMLLGHYHGQRI